MTALDRIVTRMRQRADAGPPCRSCGTTARDCQVAFLLTDMWCCPTCRTDGGRASHATEGGEQ